MAQVGYHRRRTTEPDFTVPGLFKRLKRKCLGCGAPFDSAWAGERICQGCKATTAWRSGASAHVMRSDRNLSSTARKGGS